METFVWIVLAIVIVIMVGISIWTVIKNNQSDEVYEKAIDEIYGRKR